MMASNDASLAEKRLGKGLQGGGRHRACEGSKFNLCVRLRGGGGRICGRPVPLPVIRPPRDFTSLASVGGGRFGGTIRYIFSSLSSQAFPCT